MYSDIYYRINLKACGSGIKKKKKICLKHTKHIFQDIKKQKRRKKREEEVIAQFLYFIHDY